MQRVRLDTAYAHILLSDKATVASGYALLIHAGATALQFGTSHQHASIDKIRHDFESVN
jgi:hypothetical protein